MRFGRTISFYLVRAVVPYFFLAWIILTVILFVQQAGRYSEIFFDPNLPSSFIWQLAFALIPNVIAFTSPMAVLAGVIIGMSRMHGDNELTAIRTFGVGSGAAVLPILVLGIVLSFFSIAVNIFGVPLASKAVRMVALRTAIYKLESPIEPGVFNTEIAGATVYVRGVDIETKQWRNVFVYTENAEDGSSRLITSRSGRIDSTGNSSELVLSDAVVSTLKAGGEAGNLVSENIGELRFAVKTRRDEMVTRLSQISPAIEELGIIELNRFSGQAEGKDKVEAQILIVRRLMLAIAPILFSVLGATLVLRLRRSRRGSGAGIALISLLVYFLLTFAGEQLARSGTVPVIIGGLLPVFASIIAIIYFWFSNSRFQGFGVVESIQKAYAGVSKRGGLLRRSDIIIDLTTGIRDFEIATALLRYYFAAIVLLASVFLIFTAFELWRFAGSMPNGPGLLGQYIFFLVPYTYLQLSPTAVMIAILATFAIKARQNEIVTWIAAGQSIYRLLVPCLLLMLILGGVNVLLQETIAPSTNQNQDRIRRQLRTRGVDRSVGGRFWVANDTSIAFFTPATTASDNEQSVTANCRNRCTLRSAGVYRFEADKAELQSLYHVSDAIWENGELAVNGKGFRFEFDGQKYVRTDISGTKIQLARSTFSGSTQFPSHLTAFELRENINDADSEIERRKLQIALQKRYAAFLLPLVIALFTEPFALGMDRSRRVISIAYGVGMWLIFVAVGSAFEQLGVAGTLPPRLAVWAPIMAFSMIGIYLLSKVRT